MSTAERVRAAFEEHQIKRVKVGGFDVDGILRGKYISVEKFWSVVEGGLGFCDVIFGWDSGDRLVGGLEATGWHTGYPDALARIDPATRRSVPWDPGTALLLVDFSSARTGEPGSHCPM